tara:strand:- start:410 stop:517 length:108 start_codon:yes stop_codon:yes gene_type:complete
MKRELHQISMKKLISKKERIKELETMIKHWEGIEA